ncbi:MAG: metallophosphoesterase family protein [Polyangiales bacterium]
MTRGVHRPHGRTARSFAVTGVRGPLAFLADIHGNLAALDAVLGALKNTSVAGIFVAGDLLLGGEQPLEVWMRLQEIGAHCVAGTSDRALAMLDPARIPARDDAERARLARFARTQSALGDVIIARLKRLPEAMRLTVPGGDEWLLVHGSPRDPDTVISHDLSTEEVEALVDGDPADVVICGGGHVPFAHKLDESLVVSVGSVGEAPEGGIAHYTLLWPGEELPVVDPQWVAYGAS